MLFYSSTFILLYHCSLRLIYGLNSSLPIYLFYCSTAFPLLDYCKIWTFIFYFCFSTAGLLYGATAQLFFSVLLLTITTLLFYCSSCYAHYDNLLFYVLHFCSTILLPCCSKTLLRSCSSIVHCFSTAILVCCSFIVQHLLTPFMLCLLAKFYSFITLLLSDLANAVLFYRPAVLLLYCCTSLLRCCSSVILV
jgi:hypothetical protein